MAQPQQGRKLIWAIDPFCDDCSLVQRTARAVRALASQWDAAVEPAYVFGDFPFREESLSDLVLETTALAEERLRRILRGISIPGLLPLRVLVSTSAELRAKADELLAHARRDGADTIALGTRARSGPARWFMGSFAESLTFRSDLPLYVINPICQPPRRLNHILFPTDFSSESEAVFGQVIRLARELGASLTVFHKIVVAPAIAVDSGFTASLAFLDLEFDRMGDAAKAWAREAQNAGIEADFLVDRGATGSVVDSILRRAHPSAGMIAMAARSGRLATALLGSTTRQVLRTSRCPVWVIHAERRKFEAAPKAA